MRNLRLLSRISAFAFLGCFAALYSWAGQGLSPVITVDTRDLDIGDLSIQGPDTIMEGADQAYTAWLDGSDVSDLCEWEVRSSNWELGYGYPTIGEGIILLPRSSVAGDVLTLTAAFTEPGGDRRQAVKTIPVLEGNGLRFGVSNPFVVFGGGSGGLYLWDATASVYGQAKSKPGVTFTWYRDGVPFTTGTNVNWSRTGLPLTENLVVEADDGQGNTSAVTFYVAYEVPAVDEVFTRYYDWSPKGGRILDWSGTEDAVLDPAKSNDGLVIIVHGTRSSGTNEWVISLATSIRLELWTVLGDNRPTVVIYDWEKDASPGRYYETTEERLAYLRSSVYLKGSTLKYFRNNPILGNWLFDIAIIRPVARMHGRDNLAAWIRTEYILGNISKSAPIHLIGHSAGGFLVGECNEVLKKTGYNVQRVTMLDTPLALESHVNAGNPAVIERYVSSILGDYCTDIDHILSLWPVRISNDRNESTYYHRLDIGDGGALTSLGAHKYSHTWYESSVYGGIEQGMEGFQLSPFVTGASSGALALEEALPASSNEPVAAGAVLPPETLDGFDSFGTVSGGAGTPYVLTEATNAGIHKDFILPVDAAVMTFTYQFSGEGDGEYLMVHFGDTPPLFLARVTASSIADPQTAEVPIAAFAGESGDLVIKLVAQGEASGVLTIDNIQIVRDDDFDGDGILAADEVLAGTDPRFADTDGDGIDDATELNGGTTSPVLADTDGDGGWDGDEIEAGTDPADPLSRLAITGTGWNPGGFGIVWDSVADRSYRVLRSREPAFMNYDVIASGVSGEVSEKSHEDTAADPTLEPSFFYKVEVE